MSYQVIKGNLVPFLALRFELSFLVVWSPKPWEQSQGKPHKLQQTSQMAKQEVDLIVFPI